MSPFDRIAVTVIGGYLGSGKTTLINMIAGLARPEAGRISVAGTVLFDSDLGIDVAPERRRIGYVFQDARLFPHLNVRSNLLYGFHCTPRHERRVTPEAVIALLGIEALLERRTGRLSGGEKQRVAIGRALLTSPRLLLMDEPLASLDAGRKAEVLPFVRKLHRETNVPVVYVSHALDEVLYIADTMAVIDRGRVTAMGPVEETVSRALAPDGVHPQEPRSVLAARIVRHANCSVNVVRN